MSLRIAYVLAALLLLAGCGDPFAPDDATWVRLENASAVVMESVEVPGVGGFGALGPGEVTTYVRVDAVHRYPSVSAVVDGERVRNAVPLVLTPPLDPGRYTYVVTYSPRPARLDAETREDG